MKHFNLPLNFAVLSDGTNVVYEVFVYGFKIKYIEGKMPNWKIKEELSALNSHKKCTFSYTAAAKRVSEFPNKFGEFPLVVTFVQNKTVYVLNTL